MSPSRTITLITLGAVALVAAVLAMPAAARADLAVTFDLSQAKMTYTASSQILTATEGTASTFTVNLEEMRPTSTVVLDRAMISGGSSGNPFDFLLTMKLTDLPGVDNWSATGVLTFTDTYTDSNAVMADFKSSSIAIMYGAAGYLEIRGYLSTSSGQDSILLSTRGDPWKFMGQDWNTPGPSEGEPDADGVDGQITRAERAAQDNGALVCMKFAIGEGSLDTLFSGDRSIGSGQVMGSVVPAPAAVVLGLMGLGMVGMWMRRYA